MVQRTAAEAETVPAWEPFLWHSIIPLRGQEVANGLQHYSRQIVPEFGRRGVGAGPIQHGGLRRRTSFRRLKVRQCLGHGNIHGGS
jgi:hypothetical protein